MQIHAAIPDLRGTYLYADYQSARFFALRAGYSQNLAESDIGALVHAGIGVNLWVVRIDLAGAMALETTEYDGNEVPREARLGFQLLTVITLTTGTAFLMWIGEQITERGVSNGISLLIFASIITGLPRGIGEYFAANMGGGVFYTSAGPINVNLATGAMPLGVVSTGGQ